MGISQCSEDAWRDKLNTELRVGASYYGDIDLRIASASDNDDTQIRQINRFVDEGVDLLIIFAQSGQHNQRGDRQST